MSVLVEIVVGEFNFLERDVVFHPLGARHRGVGVDVQLGLELRLGLASHCPLIAGVLVAAIIGQHHVQEDKVLSFGIQTFHADLQGRKHSSERTKWHTLKVNSRKKGKDVNDIKC